MNLVPRAGCAILVEFLV